MLKMFRALRRREPIERGSTVVAYTAEYTDIRATAVIQPERVRRGLSRLAPWPAPIFVNVYELDRSYGGSEEGGWWVDTRDPVHSEQLVGTGDVWEALVRLTERFSRNVANWQGTGSVVYDGGEYMIMLENQEGEFYPSDPEAWRYC